MREAGGRPEDPRARARAATADVRISVVGPLPRIVAALEPFAPRDLVQGLREIAGSVRRVAEEQHRTRGQS